MIRVLTERKCEAGKEEALDKLIDELRAKSLHQPGYVAGETLVDIDDPTVSLVISTWTRIEAWNAWKDSQPRLEVIHLMSPLLTGEPKVRIYRVPD